MFVETIKEFIEICFSTALFINALLFMPQIIKLWRVKESKDLSILTFAGFNLIQVLAVLHGYIKQDYILMIGFLFSLITCGTVTSLIIFYRFRKEKS